MTESDVFVPDDALCRELQQAGIQKWPNTLKSGLILQQAGIKKWPNTLKSGLIL